MAKVKLKVRKVAKPLPVKIEYPYVDPEDPRYTTFARRPPEPGAKEDWRFDDKIWEEPHVAHFVTVYPHQLMSCTCPHHGETYLLQVCSPENWPQPEGKGSAYRWAVSMACGCVWNSGGLIGGGNPMAGWFRNKGEEPQTVVLARKKVRPSSGGDQAVKIKKPFGS